MIPSYRHLHTKTHLANVLSSRITIKTATVNTANLFQTTSSYREYTCWNRIDLQEVLSFEFWDTPSFITTILYHTSMYRCINSTYFYRLYTSTTMHLITRKFSTNSLTLYLLVISHRCSAICLKPTFLRRKCNMS